MPWFLKTHWRAQSLQLESLVAALSRWGAIQVIVFRLPFFRYLLRPEGTSQLLQACVRCLDSSVLDLAPADNATPVRVKVVAVFLETIVGVQE